MPVDPAHHRLLHGRGTRGFPSFTRYTQLPSGEESGSTGSTPSHSPGQTPPSRAPRALNTEVRLADGGRPSVHVRPYGRQPVARPCHKLRNAAGTGPAHTRYTKLGSVSEEGPSAGPRNGGAGILRAVASRGRGYEDLRCRGTGGDAPDSGESSAQSSPPGSPPNGRKRSGILITSALARSGIKRLSRVSFGSSKGSMVETLIYDSPVAEEERIPEEDVPPFRDPVSQKFGTETGTHQKPASKVRVTFYESSKPLVVTSPEPSEFDQFYPQDLIMASPITDGHMPAFDRQLSTDSGRDNPFRPDGDISREADEIVQLIKSGRPLQGQAGQQPGDVPDSLDVTPSSPNEKDAVVEPLVPAKDASPQQQQQQQQLPSPDTVPSKPVTDNTPSSPEKAGANGSAAPENSTPGTVEVTHATVTPTDAAHVEHVVIKKKSKCNCCVIQ